jgi:Tfp pilus assembly protein PilN
MIKINLLRTTGLQGAPQEAGAATSVDGRNDAYKKIAAILVGPLLLFAYENLTQTELRDELNQLNARVAEAQGEKGRFGDQGPRVAKYTKEKERIDSETEVVKELARNRLREVKSLDAIQSLMPPKTWIRRLEIEGNTVSMEGYSITDSGVADLIRALESSVFFSRVEPKSTSQEMLPTGPVKKFELEFRIGKRE